MALEIKKDSKWWYARFRVGKKLKQFNLGIEIEGNRPLSITQEGDGKFERSRGKAIKAHDELETTLRAKQNTEEIAQRIYKMKTGERVDSIHLADLATEWAKIPRKRPPSDRYASQIQAALGRFVTYLREHTPQVETVEQVTREMARQYLETEAARGIAAKTWNDILKVLRATFKHLLPPGIRNPFLGIPIREAETVYRKPFTPEELCSIVKAASQDDFIRPILITGICTAMRRGDCCLLKHSAVDIKHGFISVKTNKTGVTVDIPIFPMLHEELLRHQNNGSEYVFPDQATMYLSNPDGITCRARRVLAAAGFKDCSGDEGKEFRGHIHVSRQTGVRRASIRDFHSFRVTWVTVALTAGIPLELVQKVTGHKTAEIVLQHYFQPGREEFRRALQTAMPKLLTSGHKHPKDEMLEIIEGMTAESLREDVVKLKATLARL